MNEQTIQNVIDALDKCTKKACITCPYDGKGACRYEMHKDAYEVVTYLNELREKSLWVIGSIFNEVTK